MRSEWEQKRYEEGLPGGISAEDAMTRGMEFGWGKVFEGAGSGRKLNTLEDNNTTTQRLGQGLHALQDAYAHEGSSLTWSNSLPHVANDFHKSTGNARSITRDAINVYKLLTNDFGGIVANKKGNVTFQTRGMSTDQIAQVLKKIQDYVQSKK